VGDGGDTVDDRVKTNLNYHQSMLKARAY